MNNIFSDNRKKTQTTNSNLNSKNNFYGESITVSGLLTGKDIFEQLSGKELGDELLFPAVMLRADEDVFLDDLTPTELSAALGNIPLRACTNDGTELIKALLGIS